MDGLSKSPKDIFTRISLDEKFNSKGELLFWEGKYIILNSINDTPFRLTVAIRLENNHLYSVRGTVDSFFYFYDTGKTNFNFLNILVTFVESYKPFIRSKDPIKEEFTAIILAKNTLLTSNGLNASVQYGIRNYNKNWYRESLWNPKIELTRDNFYIDVVCKTLDIFRPE